MTLLLPGKEKNATATRSGWMAKEDYNLLHAQAVITSVSGPGLSLAGGALALASPPAVRLYRSAAFNVTNAGAGTAITWDGTAYDTHGMWAGGAPTHLTAPAGWGGYYSVRAGLRYLNVGGGRRSLWVQNSAGVQQAWSEVLGDAVSQSSLVVADLLPLAAGDWLDIRGFESFGATVALITGTSCFVAMKWERPL